VHEFFPAGKGSGIFCELKSGFGVGSRKLERPNVLRLSLRETGMGGPCCADGPCCGAGAAGGNAAASDGNGFWRAETLTLIEADVDDMTGESLAFLMERCFAAGALDAAFLPLVMKKGRPGTRVSVLAPQDRLGAVRECVFVHSSTLGFRETQVNRLFLPRTQAVITGAFGEAAEKTAWRGSEPLRTKIEFDDRARVARERGLSLQEAEKSIRGEAERE
jgi:uncharacterized protein (DUF111 family)